MAHATRAAVWIARRVEVGEDRLHLVAGEALPEPRDQRAPRRVACRERRHVGGEPVTHGAMQVGLAAHLREPDLHVHVTAGLRAGGVYRDEVVHLDAVTRDALHVLERARIRLEVRAVPGGGRDSLPRLLRIAAHVATRAAVNQRQTCAVMVRRMTLEAQRRLAHA